MLEKTGDIKGIMDDMLLISLQWKVLRVPLHIWSTFIIWWQIQDISDLWNFLPWPFDPKHTSGLSAMPLAMNPSIRNCFHCIKCLIRRSDYLKETRANLKVLSSNNFGTKASKREEDWIEPSGRRTGIFIYNSLTRRKDELVLPNGNILSW